MSTFLFAGTGPRPLRPRCASACSRYGVQWVGTGWELVVPSAWVTSTRRSG